MNPLMGDLVPYDQWAFAPLGDDLPHAALLWNHGADTAEIALLIHRHESVVANAIEDIRRAARSLHREAAE